MTRRSLRKTLFSLALALVMTVGFLHLGAQPAAAGFNCPSTLFGCTFSHVSYHDDHPGGRACGCCVYICPGGSEVEGPCWFL